MDVIGHVNLAFTGIAFDPPVAPGTGSPCPDGFRHWEVIEMVNELATAVGSTG